MGRKVAVTYRDRNKAEPYAEALRQAGLEPVLISPDEPRSLDGLDGLLVSGGADVNPSRYGQQPHPLSQQPDLERDELESWLIERALADDVPVLAICRGMQLFNVVHGGTLIQHLETAAGHSVRSRDPSLPAHEITVEPGTRLAEILGAGPHPVNSRHHQGVDQPGSGLKVAARAADDVIEALERPDRRFAVAVEWHPEDQAGADPQQRKLFQAFARAVEDGRKT